MTVPPSALTMARIAEIYGITRQNLYDLSGRHGIPQSAWRNPNVILCHLLESGAQSPLRSRLTNPAERARIKTEIAQP